MTLRIRTAHRKNLRRRTSKVPCGVRGVTMPITSVYGAIEQILFVLGLVFLIGSLDDLLIDIAHLLLGIGPRDISHDEVKVWNSFTEQPLAIMIPAWREANVLEAMVRTNLYRLKYANYRFFVGVYPNDTETLDIAKKLEARFPNLVTVVITDRPGPTSKAHCLNCILRVIDESVKIARRDGRGWVPKFVAIHDAEDVIHPLSFKAINALPENIDFVQVPIFSLPVSKKSWVAGTYLDEFAEIHLKEIPVRAALQMPIPSAGVGTFFSWPVMERLGGRFGYWFDEGNLTEDYEISMRLARLGARQSFLMLRDPDGEMIATREYFPDGLTRSIRQKTRWTTGISLQTWKRWGWFGALKKPQRDSLARYGLWRDRKSLWSNPISLFGWLFLFAALVVFALPSQRNVSVSWPLGLKVVLFANTALLTLRLVQRARFCSSIYGWQHGLLSLPRLLLSNIINAFAALLAIKQFGRTAVSNSPAQRPIAWDKTEHKFPDLNVPPSAFAPLDLQRKESIL